MDLGFPAGDRALFGAWVQGELDSVAGDAEVGVFDVDGDDLACLGAADAQALPGDHDDAVTGNAAFGR